MMAASAALRRREEHETLLPKGAVIRTESELAGAAKTLRRLAGL